MSRRPGKDETDAGGHRSTPSSILTVVDLPDGDLTAEQIDALLLKALSSMTGRTV